MKYRLPWMQVARLVQLQGPQKAQGFNRMSQRLPAQASPVVLERFRACPDRSVLIQRCLALSAVCQGKSACAVRCRLTDVAINYITRKYAALNPGQALY